jgi:hypothetical protein
VWLGLDAAADGPSDEPARRLDELIRAYHDAVAVRPFGDREDAAAAARAVAEWAEEQIAALRGRTFDRARARLLLARLAHMPARAADYDSARQIAWAFQTIYQEATDEADRDPTIEAALDRLTASLALDLPPAKEQLPIERGLAERLEAAARYDPAAFAAVMAEIRARLPRP